MRPPALAAVTAAMSALNLTAFMMTGDTGAFGSVAAAVIVAVSYFVLWYFWKGHNWARWLVLVTSAIAVVNLALIDTPTWPLRAAVGAAALLGLFLLYWLNTKPVRAYFTPGRNGVA